MRWRTTNVSWLGLRLMAVVLCVMALGSGLRPPGGPAGVALARPAATPFVAANPPTITAGGATVLSGGGFASNEQIQVFLDSVLKGTERVLPSGDFGGLLLVIPAGTTPGTHVIQILGLSSRLTAQLSLTVLPGAGSPASTLSLSPSTVIPGGQIVVSGSGFFAGETVVVRINGNLFTTTVASPTGTFSGVVLTIPVGTASGSYTVSAIGASSNVQATAALTVASTTPVVTTGISLNPAAALRGVRVQASGTGFVPGELVLITINNVVLASATADASGSFVNLGFTVPSNLNPGPVAVVALGATSQRVANTVLTVLATPVATPARVSVSPSGTVPGGRVTIEGSGFQAHEIILIKVDGAIVLSPTADANGAFSVSYTVRLALGGHSVVAVGAASQRTVSTTLAVGRPVLVGMHLVPNRSHRGELVHVAGINFLPGETVLVRFRGVIVQAATATSQGVVNAVFTVPGNTPYGASVVSLQGARSGRGNQALLGILPAPSGGVGIHLSTASLHHGGKVAVSGHGFQTGEIVLIRFRGALVQSAQADHGGSFNNAVFVIGLNVPFGTFTVQAIGANSGRTASARVKVAPATGPKPVSGVGITVSATRITRGQSVTVSGHGYQGGEFVLIRLRGMIVQAVAADKHGSFRATFRVDSHEAKGATTIQATGARSNRVATVKVTVI